MAALCPPVSMERTTIRGSYKLIFYKKTHKQGMDQSPIFEKQTVSEKGVAYCRNNCSFCSPGCMLTSFYWFAINWPLGRGKIVFVDAAGMCRT